MTLQPLRSKDATKSPKWRLWNSQDSLEKAVQRRQILGVSGKDPQHSCVCHFPGTYQCEAAGCKEGLTELVRNQSGDARAKRHLQNTTNKFFNGIFLFYNKSTFIKVIKQQLINFKHKTQVLSQAAHLLYITVLPECGVSQTRNSVFAWIRKKMYNIELSCGDLVSFQSGKWNMSCYLVLPFPYCDHSGAAFC